MLGTKRNAGAAVREHIGRQVAQRLDANPAAKKAQIDSAQIYYVPGYLSERDCDTLMRLIDAGSRRSTILTDNYDPEFRTSDSCDLDRWSPEIRPIDERLASLLGIDPHNGETLQGQRYAPGQQFRAHHDFFHETESYWERMKQEGGQRTWTAMIYLNDVEEGGATWFPQAGVRFKPKRGLLLAWNNMKPDGTPNHKTLHEGMAVVKGTKYIVTKWFRESAWLK
ncbi:2OG-Fe(II) oxygenase [Stakelama saccharophila]|uniref:2OG-Fe(II) oxygenase n=1 Tax=Stakelama saccharophila TaxID=3075605 RepID=A0ABZ0BD44_9SPHN|nr:2OG-Fe(II) oxygenase [Stakelama sp. W311]WNO55112.1 2OG-Fe(II) oxygenase [Stakelama sp. W311]